MLLLLLGGYIAFQVSPWPSVLLIRYAFNRGGVKSSAKLEKHVPAGVSARLNEHYDANDMDASFDVYYPAGIENTDSLLLTIVWIHGGGWVSGTKDHIANYCKILASKGYAVVALDYSIAPGHHYPTPVKQVNTALSYLKNNGKPLHIDANRIVLGGDSAGANIAAQVANIISEPSYSNVLSIVPTVDRGALRGAVLFCGPYDARAVELEGTMGFFIKSIVWSYSGTRDFEQDSLFATVSVINYVSDSFPPTFISVGNGDPLSLQSHAFAHVLTSNKVYVDSLFYPDTYTPELPHEYQFNLDTEAGMLSLERLVKFLAGLDS